MEAGQEVKAGDLLYVLDSSDAEDEILEYEVNLEDLYEQRADIQESIANQRVTAPFSGRIENIQVEAGDDVQSGMTLATLVDDSAMKATLYFSYAYEGKLYTGMGVTLSIPDQMLTLDGEDTGSVVIYNQESMEISINVDELDVDYLEVGMPVTVYRSTSSGTVYYDGELTYLSLEATSGSSGVSTFAATVTITPPGGAGLRSLIRRDGLLLHRHRRQRLRLRPGGEPGRRFRRLLRHRLDGHDLLRLHFLLPHQQRRAGGPDFAEKRHRRVL